MRRQFLMVVLSALVGTAAAQLPNAKLTPGVVRTTSASEICAPTFRTAPYRHTTAAMKHKVCAEYHATDCPDPKKGEIDHLIPLELGGADDIRNLWWEPAPQYHDKDKVENYLRKQVCAGNMSLPAAQTAIRTDWTVIWRGMKHATAH